MTVDAEELVLMLSYDKLSMGMKKKVAKFTFSSLNTKKMVKE